jgi:hypothetical protein
MRVKSVPNAQASELSRKVLLFALIHEFAEEGLAYSYHADSGKPQVLPALYPFRTKE